ncbi:hypothetical protein [Lysobacter antibioticus]|uniref:hypothetical protein n=1 Tax=Lysobacter antibioticus TaxID=84531 RepID=UPI0011873811|nr:hypothetical protein [Lysobacter antibioticus]
MDTYIISDLVDIVIPEGGLSCCIKGLFFCSVVANGVAPKCFIKDSLDSSMHVSLPDSAADLVLSSDETFGMMVGGKFSYFGLDCIAEGILSCDTQGGLFLQGVRKIVLGKNGLSQVFAWPGSK